MTDIQPGWPTQAPAEPSAPQTYISAEAAQDAQAVHTSFPDAGTGGNGVFVESVPETPEQLIRRRDAEIQQWLDDKAALTTIKDAEANSRFKLTGTCFPNPTKGTQRYALAGGYNLKLVHGWTYTLGDKTLTRDGLPVSIYDQVVELETAIRNLGAEGNLLAERLINWKPELKVPEYEALARDTASEVEVEAKNLIDAMLTVKPASPQLAFEEPKPPK